jgi:acetyl-CoA carboxylase biotin carboxyl carrier protein
MSRPLESLWRPADDAARLTSPGVGRFRPALRVGAIVRPGDHLGLLHVLGVAHAVVAPAATHGQISALGGATAEFAVGHDGVLYALDPRAGLGEATTTAAIATTATAAGLVFRAPTSGRFYRRAAPGKPAFVEVGAELTAGVTVCLLEVMKTFNRITYGGDALPARARVVALLVGDGDDVAAGDPLLRLEPA